MQTSILKKQQKMIDWFACCKTKEDTYAKIIQFGKDLPPFPKEEKKEENLVLGCQSTVHLIASYEDEKVIFLAEADSLISQGLASLLIFVYSKENPEDILKHPPDYLEKIGIPHSLSPSRANGLYSIHLKMKQIALKMTLLKNQC